MKLKKKLELYKNPLISIGIPVFNCEKTIKHVLESLLNQTYKNIEIIISDNCSTDKTKMICKKFKDKRIKFYKQIKPIEFTQNFEFVLLKSKGEFFMWNAADDYRNEDFIETNLTFLSHHNDFVASTSRNCFEDNNKLINFSLTGDFENRLFTFFDNCWDSHGIFYSLMRTKIIKKYKGLGDNYLAFDWAINLFLLEKGKINRSEKGLLTIGSNGMSSKKNYVKSYRNSLLDLFFPFKKLTIYLYKLTQKCSFKCKLKTLIFVLKLNAKVFYWELSKIILKN